MEKQFEKYQFQSVLCVIIVTTSILIIFYDNNYVQFNLKKISQTWLSLYTNIIYIYKLYYEKLLKTGVNKNNLFFTSFDRFKLLAIKIIWLSVC